MSRERKCWLTRESPGSSYVGGVAGRLPTRLTNIGIRTGSKKAGQDVLSSTSGFHFIVNEGLRRVRSQRDGSAIALVDTWNDICEKWLTPEKSEEALHLLGLRGGHASLESIVSEVLKFLDGEDGSKILGDTSFELAMGELDGEEHRLITVQRAQLREWMRMMDLARPDGTKSSSMVVAPWLFDVISMVS